MIVFCVLLVFFITVAAFMFNELFIKKNDETESEMVISIEEWNEDVLENFIRYIKEYNKNININVCIKSNGHNNDFLNLLCEKYDKINISD